MLRIALRTLTSVKEALLHAGDVGLSRLPRPRPLRAAWPGSHDLARARRVAILMHYDSRGIFHDYVLHMLESLVTAGFAVIVVSNAPRLPATEREKVLPLAALLLWRHNVGWDFGAYRDAYFHIPDPTALDMLLIANDSVYGPFHDLRDLVRQADPAMADVWGASDNWDRRYHLQSYFLIFHQAALRNPALTAFWRQARYLRRKNTVIRCYELGLTQHLLRAGLHCRALWAYRDVLSEVTPMIEANLSNTQHPHAEYLRRLYRTMIHGAPLNQTHTFWDHLIGRRGFPFIKRDLLVKNPTGIPNLIHWENLVRSVSPYDTRMITDHLQRILRDRVY